MSRRPLVLLFALVCAAPLSGAPQYQILGPKKEDVFPLQVSRYHMFHHLHSDVFLRLKLAPRFTAAEEHEIVTHMFSNLSERMPTRLVVPGYDGTKDLIVGMRVLSGFGSRKSIILIANVSVETGSVLEPGADMKQAYARVYHVLGGRLIERSQVYSAEAEARLKIGSPLSLADFYIMDEDPKNDAQAVALLQRLQAESKDPLERFIAFLSLGQLHMVNDELEAAAIVAGEAPQRLKDLGLSPNPVAVGILNIFLRELQLMQHSG